EDADIEADRHRLIVTALLVKRQVAAGDADHPGPTLGKFGAAAIGPALIPHPVDPAFQHRRYRPPPDRKDHDGCLVALDPRHLTLDFGRIDFLGIVPVRLIGFAQYRVET